MGYCERDHSKNIFGCWWAEPQWAAPPGGCKNHRRKRRRGAEEREGKVGERKSKVQRGDAGGKVKGGGRGGGWEAKRREEVRSQVGEIQELRNTHKRKEGKGRRIWSKKLQVRGETKLERGRNGFGCGGRGGEGLLSAKAANCNFYTSKMMLTRASIKNHDNFQTHNTTCSMTARSRTKRKQVMDHH